MAAAGLVRVRGEDGGVYNVIIAASSSNARTADAEPVCPHVEQTLRRRLQHAVLVVRTVPYKSTN